MPTDEKSGVSAESISRHAQKLDSLASEWFKSYAKHHEVSVKQLNKFVKYIRLVAKDYGFLAMGVGILDRETETFKHYTHFPSGSSSTKKIGPTILPYGKPKNLEVFSKLEPLLKNEDRLIKTVGHDKAGDWIYELFEIRRKFQTLSQSPEEFDTAPKVFVPSSEIKEDLRSRINFLSVMGFVLTAGNLAPGEIFGKQLGQIAEQLGPDFFSSKRLKQFERGDNGTLFSCIDRLAKSQEFQRLFPGSDTAIFFCDLPKGLDNKDSNDSEWARRLLWKFFAKLTINDVRRHLGLGKPKGWSDFGDMSKTIPELLKTGEQPRFPVIEYLVVNLLYGGQRLNLHHIVCPFCTTLTHHSDKFQNTSPDKPSSPGLLLITFGTERRWGEKRIITRLSSFFLLMRMALEPFSDVVYYGGIERDRAISVGRQKEKTYQFVATSHELKDLTRLIPRCHGKRFLLEGLKDVFMTFSLPAASKLRLADQKLFPTAICGKKSSVANPEGDSCATYYEWICELVLLASKIQAIATPGVQNLVPKSKAQLAEWQQAIAKHFVVSEDLKRHQLTPFPDLFDKKCYLSVATLCALRNVIKHSFTFEWSRDPKTDSLLIPKWTYFWNSAITIGRRSAGETFFLEIKNQHNGKEPNDENESDGTQSAIEFYLKQLGILGDPPKGTRFGNVRQAGEYYCLLPMLGG